MKKLPAIITVAITGSLPTKEDNPAVPITVSEQIESTHQCYEAGASLVHIHVRDDEGKPCSDADRFFSVKEGIEKHCPEMIIQFSTGGRSGEGRARVECLVHKPDMASLTLGSVNFFNSVYLNEPELVRFFAEEMKRFSVKPEIEIFDLGMLYIASRMAKEGLLEQPLHFQFVLGIKGALPAKESVLDFCIKELREECPDATWGACGIGRFQRTVSNWAMAKGGHLRVGLEDNIRVSRDRLAASNSELVEIAVRDCESFNRSVSSPKEARALLAC